MSTDSKEFVGILHSIFGSGPRLLVKPYDNKDRWKVNEYKGLLNRLLPRLRSVPLGCDSLDTYRYGHVVQDISA